MLFQCIPAWLSTGFIDVPSLSSMEPSSRCSVWAGHRHRGHLEGTGGGSSERGEDSYLAAREDIELATREDFFMATDRASRAGTSTLDCSGDNCFDLEPKVGGRASSRPR
jgi:hypothetical protein